MQVIENWADIHGRIQSLNEPGDFPGFATALIDVKSVAAVPGFANLFEQANGQTVRVNIPEKAVRECSLGPGRLVSCRIRKGGPHSAFAHPQQVSAIKD
jgi:hypothetical protein